MDEILQYAINNPDEFSAAADAAGNAIETLFGAIAENADEYRALSASCRSLIDARDELTIPARDLKRLALISRVVIDHALINLAATTIEFAAGAEGN